MKKLQALAVALVFSAAPLAANASSDPFAKCQETQSHDVCFAAMSTYEERMRNASDMSEFCMLGTKYVALQGYDSVLSSNPLEHKNAYDSSKMLAGRCGEPYRGYLLEIHKRLK